MKTIGIVDLETTSLEPATGHVVEVALALYSIEHRSLIRARSWLCAAPAEAVEATQHIHGIPPALVAARGVPFEEVAKHVSAIATKEIDIFCTHHADFDRAWFPLYVQNARPWACSCDDISWPRPSTSRGLVALALAHGVGIARAHRAMDDVLTLAALFDRAAELGADVPALITRALRPKVLIVADTPKPWEMKDGEWAVLKTKLLAAGFRFEDPPKRWSRRCPREDVSTLPFPAYEVCE